MCGLCGFRRKRLVVKAAGRVRVQGQRELIIPPELETGSTERVVTFQGARVNGEDFIPAAITSGAIAVVARHEAVVEGAVHIADDNPRARFAALAARTAAAICSEAVSDPPGEFTRKTIALMSSSSTAS